MSGSFGFSTAAPMKAGTSLPGLPDVTAIGNVGTGEDDLISYSIPAGTFAADGDTIVFEGGWEAAGSVTCKIWFGGTEVTGGVVLDVAQAAPFRVTAVRLTGTTAAVSITAGHPANGTAASCPTVTGLDFTGPLVFKTTGEGTDNDDIVQKFLSGTYWPANNT